MKLNIHIHPVSLDHASRVLKSLASAGRSGCFSQRAFFGSGADNRYALKDEVGLVEVRTVPRECGPYSSFLRKSVATMRWSRSVEALARKLPAKCINVHGLSTLLLGVKLKRFLGCKLIYDTHELETKALAIRGVRRVYSEHLERSLIRFCDGVICVSDGIADWYATRYGISRPTVVRNIPDKRSQVVRKARLNLRARFGVPASGLLFVYLGRISSDRQIKQFLEVFRNLPANYHLVIIGNGELEHEVQTESKACSNIHHMSAVPPEEVIGCAAEADVGLVGVENRCLSYYLSLPNKLFESLAAGIPVIAPDFPEIRRVVNTYQCGWLWPGSGVALRTLIESLTVEEIKAKRRGALNAASGLSWELEEQGLFKLYHTLFR